MAKGEPVHSDAAVSPKAVTASDQCGNRQRPCKRKPGLHILPPMPQLIAYARDALLILVPLGGMSYFLAFPDAFDAFLTWMIGLF